MLNKKDNLKEKNKVDANKVMELHKQGLDKYQISDKIGCSHQRAYEIIRTNKE